jgi:succinyl-CoA---D-citramalate CoA-transferase
MSGPEIVAAPIGEVPIRPAPPLRGIRVLELGELLAGPFIGTLLGEFGAEVIKIERPGNGDVLRQFGPIVGGESLYWLTNSRNKKSVVLNLKNPAGREILRELIAASDVFINSLRPSIMEGWGFDEKRLRADFPRLVIVYASAFGRIGPYRNKGGYDPIAQGFSGLSYVTGEADGPPMRAGGAVPVCDFMTGIAGALGAVLSLYVRDATGDGQGQAVDIALYDVAFRMVGPLLSNFDLTGRIWERDGNHSLGGAPTGHFRTSDGDWICISVQNDDQFTRLAHLIGRAEWLDDPRFGDLKSRTANREVIESIVAAWIAMHSRQEVITEFQSARLVVGPINSVADLAADPHLAQRGYTWSEHPRLGMLRMPDVFPRLERTLGDVHDVAPALGADTLDVLNSVLHYSVSRCSELVRLGAIECLQSER